jgi:hypothetical protein
MKDKVKFYLHHEGQDLFQHRSSENKHIAQKTEELLLDSSWCCNLERMLEFLGSRFNSHVGQFDHLIKNISLIRISRSKKLERKMMYFRGALDSVHFHRMRKVTIYH